MNYIIYPDIIFIWNILINLIILFLLWRITRRTILAKIFVAGTLLMSLLSTLTFVSFYKHLSDLYIPTYALSYLIMLYYIFNCCRIKHLLALIPKYITSCIIIYGTVNLLDARNVFIRITFIFFLLVVLIIASNLISDNIFNTSLYTRATLTLKENTIVANGFIDSGNLLFTFITRKPVVILDPELTKSILPDIKDIIDSYCTTGYFNYEYAKEKADIFFSPLAYKTISNQTNIMPIFKLNTLSISNSKPHKNVYAGISMQPLSTTNDYQILVGKSLLSPKEDLSND